MKFFEEGIQSEPNYATLRILVVSEHLPQKILGQLITLEFLCLISGYFAKPHFNFHELTHSKITLTSFDNDVILTYHTF